MEYINSQMKNQRSFELTKEDALPRGFIEVPKGSIKGISQVTHIDYGYVEDGNEFPRARWCVRASPHSGHAVGLFFSGICPEVRSSCVKIVQS